MREPKVAESSYDWTAQCNGFLGTARLQHRYPIKAQPTYTASNPLIERKIGHLYQDSLDCDRSFAFGNLAPKHGGGSSCSTATADRSESADLLAGKERLLC